MNEVQIGKFIAKKRKERGLTQDELGERLGVTGKAVSKWERGLSLPDIAAVQAIASVLFCRADDILRGYEDTALSSDRGCKNKRSDSTSDNNGMTLEIETADRGYSVSPLLFGGNIEHSRSAINGGLSAQMLRNRKFVGMPNSFYGNAADWFIIGDKTYAMLGSDQTGGGNIDDGCISGSYTRHSPLGYHMNRRYECNCQILQSFGEALAGMGQHELCIKENADYEFRIVIALDRPTDITVSLTSRDGGSIYACKTFKADGNKWTTYTAALHAEQSDPDADLRITFSSAARLCIGAVSLMPTDNFHGMRCEAVELLKELGIKLLRWPGGNFAGEYNWIDGLLPCDMRAPLESHILHLTQPHTHGYDFSEINTDDFIALCREVGAEPSITINITWNTPEENAAWVEYCNGDENTVYGKMRIDRGFKEPYNVKYWSLGNEAGYGHMEGDNTPKGYRRIAAENAQAMLRVSSELVLTSSGCHPDKDWAENANNPLAEVSPLVALHNYVNIPTYSDRAKRREEYMQCLGGVDECRRKIHELRSYLDPKLQIAFDEWNCWYAWYRSGDVFSGIFTAKMFHMLITEQQKSNVMLSAVFQPINEGCFQLYPDGAAMMPMGKIFAIMSQHSGGRLLHISDTAVATGINGNITVTLINDAYDCKKTFSIKKFGTVKSAVCYYGKDIGPFTDFTVQELTAVTDNEKHSLTLPPLSVAIIKLADLCD